MSVVPSKAISAVFAPFDEDAVAFFLSPKLSLLLTVSPAISNTVAEYAESRYPSLTATAFNVVLLEIKIFPVYSFDSVVGIVPSVV